MLTISKDYEVAARNATSRMLQDISDMARVVMGDYLTFDEVCEGIGCEEEELNAILNCTVSDMNLTEYNYIFSFLESVLEQYYTDGDNADTGINVDAQGLDKDDEAEIAYGLQKLRPRSGDNDNDRDFIRKTNKNLTEGPKIDEDEAMKAKPVFNDDLTRTAKENYDNALREASIELLGTDADLVKMNAEELSDIITSRGLAYLVPEGLMGDKHAMLAVLYSKLDDKIVEKTMGKYGIRHGDVELKKHLPEVVRKLDTIWSEFAELINSQLKF